MRFMIGPGQTKHSETMRFSLFIPKLFSAFATADFKSFSRYSQADLGVYFNRHSSFNVLASDEVENDLNLSGCYASIS